MISVIIPVRNAERTIEAAIKSVLNQGISDIEVLCIVNNTTDSTEKVIEGIKDDRLKILHSSPGIVAALNEGLRNAKGEIIARQDSDDLWLPGKLQQQLQFMEKNQDIDIVGTQMDVVDVEGNYIRTTQYPRDNNTIISHILRGDNSIGHPSVIFKKKVLDKCAGYLDTFPQAEDLDLWVRSIPWFKFANLDFVGVKYEHKHSPTYDPRVPQILSSWYRMLYGIK